MSKKFPKQICDFSFMDWENIRSDIMTDVRKKHARRNVPIVVCVDGVLMHEYADGHRIPIDDTIKETV